MLGSGQIKVLPNIYFAKKTREKKFNFCNPYMHSNVFYSVCFGTLVLIVFLYSGIRSICSHRQILDRKRWMQNNKGSRKKSFSLKAGPLRPTPHPLPLSLMDVGTLECWKKRFQKKFIFAQLLREEHFFCGFPKLCAGIRLI